jgi:acyl-CoA thioester hydrolase
LLERNCPNSHVLRYDSIVNTYLIKHCYLHPSISPQIGLVVHSSSDYFAPVGFPAVLDLGLRVNKLGTSSVTYEIGVFERGVKEVKAVGNFVHVFVDREKNRPVAGGMDTMMRDGLRKLLVEEPSKL